jgi:hypothetical protein
MDLRINSGGLDSQVLEQHADEGYKAMEFPVAPGENKWTPDIPIALRLEEASYQQINLSR